MVQYIFSQPSTYHHRSDQRPTLSNAMRNGSRVLPLTAFLSILRENEKNLVVSRKKGRERERERGEDSSSVGDT